MVITSVLTPKAVLLATYCHSGLKRRVQITVRLKKKRTDLKRKEKVIPIRYPIKLERNLAGIL